MSTLRQLLPKLIERSRGLRAKIKHRVLARPVPTTAKISPSAPSFLKRSKSQKIQCNEVDIIYSLIGGDRGVMVDVGAHFGGSLAKFAKSEWQIYAFEPNPLNRVRLDEGFGSFANVYIDTRAISVEDNQSMNLFTSTVSSGISGLHAFHSSHKVHSIVKTVSLRSFMKEASIPYVDFLKVDAEGWDLFVLKSFPWEEVPSPRVVICEFEDRKTIPLGHSYFEIGDYLRSKGYRVFVSEWWPIVEYGTEHCWRNFHAFPQKLDPNAWGNLLAFKDTSDIALFEKVRRDSIEFLRQN